MFTFVCRSWTSRDRFVSAYQITASDIQYAVFVGKRRFAEDSACWPERIRHVELTLAGEVVWAWFIP